VPTGIERVEFAAVYADTLTGPFDPEESLKPGAAGGGAFPKLFGPRWLVFVPKEPVKVPPNAAAAAALEARDQDAETKGSILYHFKLATTANPAWTQLVNAPERAEVRSNGVKREKSATQFPARARS
jgi:hypothetical protein